jgi:hypothetical protein
MQSIENHNSSQTSNKRELPVNIKVQALSSNSDSQSGSTLKNKKVDLKTPYLTGKVSFTMKGHKRSMVSGQFSTTQHRSLLDASLEKNKYNPHMALKDIAINPSLNSINKSFSP